MFITADQILAHMVGDYLLQSHWMATEKTKRSLAAGVHAGTYTLPFLFLGKDGRHYWYPERMTWRPHFELKAVS
jgi:hypothetical protein